MNLGEILNSINIDEEVHGFLASVYHRTRASDLVNHVYTSGFKPGYGAMYGKGFYSTYNLESQMQDGMSVTYGPVVVKFAVKLQNFFFFDWDAFSNHPLRKSLNATENDFLQKQDEYYGLNIGFKNIRLPQYTSDLASTQWQRMQAKGLNGIIFTGRRDGRVLVAWNTSLINPLSFYVDAPDQRKWIRAEGNIEYLRKWSQSQGQERTDLTTINPENLKKLIQNKDKPFRRRLKALEALSVKGITFDEVIDLYKTASDVFNKEVVVSLFQNAENNKEGFYESGAEKFQGILKILNSGMPIDYNNDDFVRTLNQKITSFFYGKYDLEELERLELELFTKLAENNFDFSKIKENAFLGNDVRRILNLLKTEEKTGKVKIEKDFLTKTITNYEFFGSGSATGSIARERANKEQIKQIVEYVKKTTGVTDDEIFKKVISDSRQFLLARNMRNLRDFGIQEIEASTIQEVLNSTETIRGLDNYTEFVTSALSSIDNEKRKKINLEKVYTEMERRVKKTSDSNYTIPVKFGRRFSDIVDFDRLFKITLKSKNSLIGLMYITKVWPEGSYDCEKIIDLIIKRDKKGDYLSQIFTDNMKNKDNKSESNINCTLTKEHLKKALDSLEKSRYAKDYHIRSLKRLYGSLSESLQLEILRMID